MTEHESPQVGIVMGSKSDWPTMKLAADILEEFEIPHECRVVSAHRTPRWMAEYAETAESRGIQVIIAGAGGAAHLPGMIASQTPVPVLGVPVKSRALSGLDSLLSIVQMPGGVVLRGGQIQAEAEREIQIMLFLKKQETGYCNVATKFTTCKYPRILNLVGIAKFSSTRDLVGSYI